MKYYNIIDKHGVDILRGLGNYISNKLLSDEVVIEYFYDTIINKSYNLTILVKYDIYQDSKRIIIYFTKEEIIVLSEVFGIDKQDLKKWCETYLDYIHRKKVINELL